MLSKYQITLAASISLAIIIPVAHAIPPLAYTADTTPFCNKVKNDNINMLSSYLSFNHSVIDGSTSKMQCNTETTDYGLKTEQPKDTLVCQSNSNNNLITYTCLNAIFPQTNQNAFGAWKKQADNKYICNAQGQPAENNRIFYQNPQGACFGSTGNEGKGMVGNFSSVSIRFIVQKPNQQYPLGQTDLGMNTNVPINCSYNSQKPSALTCLEPGNMPPKHLFMCVNGEWSANLAMQARKCLKNDVENFHGMAAYNTCQAIVKQATSSNSFKAQFICSTQK